MSEKKISTVDELKDYLKSHLSEKRFRHSLNVAQTTDMILRRYGFIQEEYLGFKAAEFCGLAHDIAREFSDSEIVGYCLENNIKLDSDEKQFPVLAHGKVSASVACSLFGDYPENWKKAICEHTTGDCNMDAVSLALFCADYIEPSRVFLSDEKRNEYLSCTSLKECAYRILCDMMKHWKEKGNHISCSKSLAMKTWLEDEI